MMRALLADRFALRIRRETREAPTYALTPARPGKLGPGLKLSSRNCTAIKAEIRKSQGGIPRDMGDCTDYDFNVPKKGAMTLKYTGTIGDLVQRAAGFVDRPLVDETGLSGKFEWNVSFWLDPPSPEGPSIYEAFEQELGLQLERRRGSIDVHVIDSVSMPTAN